jgi:hypothetical protein
VDPAARLPWQIFYMVLHAPYVFDMTSLSFSAALLLPHLHSQSGEGVGRVGASVVPGTTAIVILILLSCQLPYCY